jgi:hypothetical protein
MLFLTHDNSSVLSALLKDSLLYVITVAGVNFLNVMFVVAAPYGIQSINA